MPNIIIIIWGKHISHKEPAIHNIWSGIPLKYVLYPRYLYTHLCKFFFIQIYKLWWYVECFNVGKEYFKYIYMRRECYIHTKTTWKMNFAAFNRSHIYFKHRTKSRFINIDRDGFCVGLYICGYKTSSNSAPLHELKLTKPKQLM